MTNASFHFGAFYVPTSCWTCAVVDQYPDASTGETPWRLDAMYRSMFCCAGPMVQQERPSQAQLVSNESTSATSSRKAVQASALGSMVPTDVKAPSAEALLHKKLVKRAGALEETITQLTAALSQTNGGALLKDKGAKLHSGLQTAEEELAATQKSLNELAASEVATSGGSSANRQADVLADMLERTELK